MPRFSRRQNELDDWQQIQAAHAAMRQGRFGEAMEGYRAMFPVLKPYVVATDRYPDWSALRDSEEAPSLGWLCIYLTEFYQMMLTWPGWRWLASRIWIQAAFADLALPVRSRLISAKGWASFRHNTLRRIVAEQTEMLERLAGQDRPFEEALHHMVLSYAYQLALRDSPSRSHAEAALDRIDPTAEPYYAVRALMFYGAMHRTFNRFDESLEVYARQQMLVERIGAQDTPLATDFVNGWSYLGAKQFQPAVRSFERAVEVARRWDLPFENARYLNGLGYAWFRQGEYDRAADAFEGAIRLYYDRQHTTLKQYCFDQETHVAHMWALCMHNVALVEEYRGGRANLEQALKDEQSALGDQRTVDDPGPLCDMLRRAMRLSWKLRRPLLLARYTLEVAWLRWRYPIPFFCPPLPEVFCQVTSRLLRVVGRA